MDFFTKYIRMSNWWHYKIAHLMGFVYAIIYVNDITFSLSLTVIPFFLPAAFGVAALGYFINDWADMKTDAITAKKNYLSGLSSQKRFWGFALVMVLAVGPWFFMKTGPFVIVLLITQCLLYLMYSLHPLRLKNRGAFGLLADTAYGHIIPVLVTIMIFNAYGNPLDWHNALHILVPLLLLLFFKGLRNIMTHQIEDRRNDRHSGIQTFVVKKGGLFAVHFVNRLLLPAEIALLLFFSMQITIIWPVFLWLLLTFFVFTYLKFSMWLLFVLPYRQLKFKFLFFLNDFYEDWFPLIMLAYLCQKDSSFYIFLLGHMVFFPKSIYKFAQDLNTIIKKI